jgi:hypothetical protein
MLVDWKRRLTVTAVAACGLAIALLALAHAAPATLERVSQSGGRISATWSLPPGSTEADNIEVSKSRAVDGEGGFESLEEFDGLQPDQTSWTSPDRFEPGTYFVHVATSDPDCDECPIFEYSNVLKVTVPGGTGGAPGGSKPQPGRYAGPVGDLGDRIRFRLTANRRAVRSVVARFTLNCPNAGLFKQRLKLKRIRVRKGRFRFKQRGRRRGVTARVSLRGRFVPPRRARGRLNVQIRARGVGRCRTLSGGRRGLPWTATRR